ncbi:putative oxidoreductase [Lachnellula hyalina]|uniref:Putative oxidoreductase n=1 Tax=Lachnellula hyalina TaxID=1316788 RepID=A0A8H8U2F1_9HELO|nr:putative oxidoreductase [Lachnellula hyalina]TVY28031.1 putative oxidoreductase [Lachnellula hyalina]
MASQTHPRLGWIGLGSMGLAMATNLQKHLKANSAAPLHFTNRTLSRGAPLEKLGGVPIASVSEVLKGSDIIFLSLSDDAALQSIVSQILTPPSGSLAGKIIVDTTTVHPDTTSSIASTLTEAGALFVAAPVFGASPVAATGQLLFIVAGPQKALDAIKPFLKGVMGRGVIELGEDASKASLMKTSGNFITAAMMEMISEAHVFAEKTGLGSENMEMLIKENYGELAYTMSKRLTTGAYCPPKGESPWSDLGLGIKDVGIGISCAEKAGTRLKVGEVALGHLKEASVWAEEEGVGRKLDSSSMFGVIRRDAGLEFQTEGVKERDS